MAGKGCFLIYPLLTSQQGPTQRGRLSTSLCKVATCMHTQLLNTGVHIRHRVLQKQLRTVLRVCVISIVLNFFFFFFFFEGCGVEGCREKKSYWCL